MISNARLHRSMYKVVGAADSLRGARRTASGADDCDRRAAEPDQTFDGEEDDPQESAKGGDRRGGCLQREPWLANRTV